MVPNSGNIIVADDDTKPAEVRTTIRRHHGLTLRAN
jgi:hypothetical protein